MRRRRSSCPPSSRGLASSILHVLFYVAGLLYLVSSLPAATFKVGSAADGACTHSDLSTVFNIASLNGTGEDLILIAGNQTYTAMALLLINTAATVRGGYSDCSDTSPSGRTVIDGTGGALASVIEISRTTTGNLTVTLENLEIRGGEDDADDGGGLEIDGPVTVNLSNTWVHQNTSDSGGGVHIAGSGAWLNLLSDSRISGNTANVNGGGIHCEGGAWLSLDGEVSFNDAVDGGGVHLEGCGAGITSGAFSEDGISFNTASGDGGGIYLADVPGSPNSASLYGPAQMIFNEAVGDGGAIYLAGADTSLEALMAQIGGNQATGDGGAIYVTDGASLTYGGVGVAFCVESQGCSEINDNASGGFGGAIAVTGGAKATVGRTWLVRNSAVAGSAGFVEGVGSELRFESAVLWSNDGATAVQAGDNGWLQLAMVSTWGNNDGGFFASAQGLSSTVRLLSSIIWEGSGLVLHKDATATAFANCLIVHEAASFSGSAISVQDPQYRNPANVDLHLRPTSPAIDFCNAAVFSPTMPDVDFEARGLEAPKANALGPYDLGADESTLMFADGFESGDVSAWSLASP